MIIFGSHELLKYLDESFIIKNLSSYINEYRRDLSSLVPPLFVHYDDKDFDIQYAQYILSSDAFFDLFRHVIFPGIYMHEDVYVLVHRDDDVYDKLTDSLQKFIAYRYGINTFLVNDTTDLTTAISSARLCSVTREPIHISNLDEDMKRFSNYIINTNPSGVDMYDEF